MLGGETEGKPVTTVGGVCLTRVTDPVLAAGLPRSEREVAVIAGMCELPLTLLTVLEESVVWKSTIDDAFVIGSSSPLDPVLASMAASVIEVVV